MGKKNFWSICTDSNGYETFCSIWFRIFFVALIVGFVIWRESTLSEDDKQRRHERRHERRHRRMYIFFAIVGVFIIYVGLQKIFK